jgi:hypothetical protein
MIPDRPAPPAARLEVVFGALVDPLYRQLKLPRRLCAGVQELANAITLLKIAGMLTDAQAHTARQKLMKRLTTLKASHL